MLLKQLISNSTQTSDGLTFNLEFNTFDKQENHLRLYKRTFMKYYNFLFILALGVVSCSNPENPKEKNPLATSETKEHISNHLLTSKIGSSFNLCVPCG